MVFLMINLDNLENNWIAAQNAITFHAQTPEINSLSIHLKNLTIRTVPGLLEYQWTLVNNPESTPWLTDLQRRLLLGRLHSQQKSRNHMYGAACFTTLGMNLWNSSTDSTSSLLLGRLGIIAGSIVVAAGATYTAALLNSSIEDSFKPKDWLNNLYGNA